MGTAKSYRPWTPDQPFLLPADPRDWLPVDHLVHFVLEIVGELDLSPIEAVLQARDPRGERSYDPRMMTSLLVYGYCTGVFSSRKIERKTYEDVAFRYLSGGEHPDFSTLCTFRRTHLAAFQDLFVQVVGLARRAGLAKLGHVSLDGSKFDANASKHKAMSYDRMEKDEARLRHEIQELVATAERRDTADDERLGEGVPETDLPAELKRREDRLAKIRAAKAALEEEARAARAEQLRVQAAGARTVAAGTEDEAERARALARAARREDAANALVPTTTVDAAGGPAGNGSGLPRHRPKVTRVGRPKPTAQRNFTDPDSRIMDRGGQIAQAYNGQAAVDSDHQVIVAQGVSNQPPDTHYFVPMLERVRDTTGALPAVTTADAGYWAPENAAWAEANGVDAYIATQRHRRSAPPTGPPAALGPVGTPQERMRHKVSTPEGQKIYRRRKCIPEPVFGQIKQAMGFRRFSLRGMAKVQGEWALVCMSHNVRKLWSAGIGEA